jgi:hypothetical protein
MIPEHGTKVEFKHSVLRELRAVACMACGMMNVMGADDKHTGFCPECCSRMSAWGAPSTLVYCAAVEDVVMDRDPISVWPSVPTREAEQYQGGRWIDAQDDS